VTHHTSYKLEVLVTTTKPNIQLFTAYQPRSFRTLFSAVKRLFSEYR